MELHLLMKFIHVSDSSTGVLLHVQMLEIQIQITVSFLLLWIDVIGLIASTLFLERLQESLSSIF
uniref:Uncharacterized protein n=1 Tax=Picea sitchensis TaxID=3332 RepID=A9P2C0_PICSI|nr:unknown [Picea sitchensis]